MNLRRRDFLAAVAVAGASVASSKASAADNRKAPITPKRKAVLKLSSQAKPVGCKELEEQLDNLDNMEKWGFEGIEFHGRWLSGNVKKIKTALKGRPIKVSAICGGFEGCIISDDPEQRKLAMTSMKELLAAAGELESTGMIIVPAFNNQKSPPNKEARELLIPLLPETREKDRQRSLLEELGEYAISVGSQILLEPLNRKECYFLRQLADAAAICRDVNSPGIQMMGDFWHMTWEETSDLGAFISAGDYLHHVHMASRRRRMMPGEDGQADNYVLGFKGLKWIGYQDYVSLECGCVGDKNVAIPAAVKLIREQWAQA